MRFLFLGESDRKLAGTIIIGDNAAEGVPPGEGAAAAEFAAEFAAKAARAAAAADVGAAPPAACSCRNQWFYPKYG